MLKLRCLLLAILVAVVAFPAAAFGVHLRAKIIRVGFPGSSQDQYTQGADFYRPGHWTPILVELTNEDSDLFEGSIHARQLDRDGDEAVSRTMVAVRGTKYQYLYVPAGTSTPQPPSFAVRVSGPGGAPVALFNDQNQPVNEVGPTQEPRPVASDAQMILDISEGGLPQLRSLVSEPLLVHRLVVTRVAPAQLPDQAPGLDMADMIVWDAADPTAIDLPQREALLQWTQRGGTLVMGVGKNWDLIARSQFGSLLPGRLTGVSSASLLPGLGEVLFGSLPNTELERPLTYCPVKQDALAADATMMVPSKPASDGLVFVASRPCGRGRIVLVTAQIADLISRANSGNITPFLREILGLRKYAEEQKEPPNFHTDLFGYIEQMTGFRTTTGMYFLVAFLFVVVYIGISTLGSWNWLKRRKRVQYAWPAFAAVAVLASGTSLAAVQFIRGIGQQLQQLTIVDARAGSPEATATCYFGLKTASHMLLDLTLPANWQTPDESQQIAGALLPLPPDPEGFDRSVYSAGQQYDVLAPIGQLWAVPMRATLKQFQGTWKGDMKGELDAALHRRDPTSHRFTAGSWIENKLQTDLNDCYLFVTSQNISGERTYRSMLISVYPVGRLPAGKRTSWGDLIQTKIKAAEKQKGEKANTAAESADLAPQDWVPLPLSDLQSAWLTNDLKITTTDYQPYRGEEERIKPNPEQFKSALLLLTTYDEIDTRQFAQNMRGIQRTRGAQLDRSAHVTRETALLVGFTSIDAGPARLCWRTARTSSGGWKPIQPTESNVMYRFLIPLGR